MKVQIKRALFSMLITSVVYFSSRDFQINTFYIGFWCAWVYRLSEEKIFFLCFPRLQKYVIRLTNKRNKYQYEWLTSMNPDDRQVKSNRKDIALRFDTELEAREVLQELYSKGGWEQYFVDVKKFYN